MSSNQDIPNQKKRYLVLQSEESESATCVKSESYTDTATDLEESNQHAEASRFPAVDVERQSGSTLSVVASGKLDDQKRGHLLQPSNNLKIGIDTTLEVKGKGHVINDGPVDSSFFTYVKDGSSGTMFRATNNQFNKISYGLYGGTTEEQVTPGNIFSRLDLLPLDNGNLLHAALSSNSPPGMWNFKSSLTNFDNSPDGSITLNLFDKNTRAWSGGKPIVESADNRDLADFRGSYANSMNFTGISLTQDPTTGSVYLLYCGFWGDNFSNANSTFNPSFLCVDKIVDNLVNTNVFGKDPIYTPNERVKTENISVTRVNTARLDYDATNPKILPDVDGLDAESKPMDLSAEFLADGRLVVCMFYEDSIYSLVSIDKGRTFQANLVKSIGTHYSVVGHVGNVQRVASIDTCISTDGSIAMVAACPNAGDPSGHRLKSDVSHHPISMLSVFSSSNGYSWGAERNLSFDDRDYYNPRVTVSSGNYRFATVSDLSIYALDVSICLTPDRYLMVSAASYNVGGPGGGHYQALFQRVLDKRDVSQSASVAAIAKAPSFHMSRSDSALSAQAQRLQRAYPNVRHHAGTNSSDMLKEYIESTSPTSASSPDSSYLGQLYFGGVSARLVPIYTGFPETIQNQAGNVNYGGGPMRFAGPISVATCLWRDSVVTTYGSYRSDAVYDYPAKNSLDTTARSLSAEEHTGFVKVLFSGGMQPAHIRIPTTLQWNIPPLSIDGQPTDTIQIDKNTFGSRNETLQMRQCGSNSWQLAYDACVLPEDDDCKFAHQRTSSADVATSRPLSDIVNIFDTHENHDGNIGRQLELNSAVTPGSAFSNIYGMTGSIMSVDTTASTIEIPLADHIFFIAGDYVFVGNAVFRVVSKTQQGAMTYLITLSSSPPSTATEWQACNRLGGSAPRIYMRWPNPSPSHVPGDQFVSQLGATLTVPESGRFTVNNSATGFGDVRDGDSFTAAAQGISGTYSGTITNVNSTSFDVIFSIGDIAAFSQGTSQTITVATQLNSNLNTTVNRTFSVTGTVGTAAVKEIAFWGGATGYGYNVNGTMVGLMRTWFDNPNTNQISNGHTVSTFTTADQSNYAYNMLTLALANYSNQCLKVVDGVGNKQRLTRDGASADDREDAFSVFHTSNLSFLSRAVLTIDQGGGYIWDESTQTGQFYGSAAGLKTQITDGEALKRIDLMLLVGRDETDPTRVGFAIKDFGSGTGVIRNIIHLQDDGAAFEDGKMRSPMYEVMFCLSWETKMSNPIVNSGAELRLLVRKWDRHADPDFLADYTHSVSRNSVSIQTVSGLSNDLLGFGIYHQDISSSWDHTETTMRIRSYSHCSSFLKNSQCFARVLEVDSSGDNVMDIFTLDGRDSAQILGEIDPTQGSTSLNMLKYNNGGTFSPSKPPLTSTFPLLIDSGIEVSFAGSAVKRDTFNYFDDSLFRAENVFSLPVSAGWMSPSRTLEYATMEGTRLVTPSHQLVYDFGENGVMPDSVCLFGVNTDEVMVDFYDNLETGLGYLESDTNPPSLSLWFGSPRGALYELFLRMVDSGNWPTMEPFTDISFRPNYLFHWRYANWSQNRRGGIRAAIGDPDNTPATPVNNKTIFFYEVESQHLPVSDISNMSPRVRQETGLFIPGRFKSGPGENYYLVLNTTRHTTTSNGHVTPSEALGDLIKDGDNINQRAIFKIEDNGVSWIKLTKSVGDYVIKGSHDNNNDMYEVDSMSIFSDRMGSNLPEYFPLLEKSNPNSGRDLDFDLYNRYRYMRVRLSGARMMDKDVPSLDLGMVIAGRRVELANPDIEWGWSYNMEFGNKLTTGLTGQRRRRKQHKPRRSWEVSYSPKKSPQIDKINQNGRLADYQNEYRGYGATRERTGLSSEQETQYNRMSWLEAVQRIVNVEVNGQVFALCFDGDKMVSLTSAHKIKQKFGGYSAFEPLQNNKVRQALSDPHQFCVARVTDYGGASHEGYHVSEEFTKGYRFGEPGYVDLIMGLGTEAQKHIGKMFSGKRVLPVMKINKIVFSEEF